LIMDSQTNVDIIAKWSSKSDLISSLLQRLAVCASNSNLTIVTEHRLGVDNHWPDLLSRPNRHRYRSVDSLRSDRTCVPGSCADMVSRVSWVCSAQLPLEPVLERCRSTMRQWSCSPNFMS
jgi:hypothetical protein